MATIIDDNYDVKPDVSIWPTAIRYGLFIGLAGILLQVLGDLIGFNTFDPNADGLTKAYGYIGSIVGIVLTVLSVKTVRDELLGGRIGFGKAYGTAMATALVSVVITAVWTYIYFSFIADPAILETVRDAALQNAQIDEDQEGADVAIGMVNSMLSPGGIALTAALSVLVISALINLLIAAVMKKE